MRLEGADVLAMKLKAMDHEMRRKFGRAGARDGAKVIAERITELAPPPATAPYHIKESIKVTLDSKRSTRWSWVYQVRWSGKVFYAKFIEFGTSYFSAEPFFRPGFEQSKYAAASKVALSLRKRLRKYGLK